MTMRRRQFTRWTKELRDKLFSFKRTTLWGLNHIITEETKTMRKIRLHPQNKNSLEDLNYRKNRIQAAREEMEVRKLRHGEKAVREYLTSGGGEIIVLKERPR